jgi:probable rRNA maturation factor
MSLSLNIDTKLPADLSEIKLKSVLLNIINNFKMVEELTGVVEFSLVDSATMRELNRDFADNDYATDVLSFAYNEAGELNPDEVFGEIILDLGTAEKQALEHNHGLLDELILLSIHGLLHLVGYDHQNSEDKQIMDAKAAEILKMLDY